MKRLCKLIITPNCTKEENFSLALADYFTQEFKNNDFNAKNCKGYVQVLLDKPYQYKYSSIIIDCVDGKMYLRGNNIKDKYFGRLSKFKVNRASDAYNCVNYNITRIINRIKALDDTHKEVLAVCDLRRNVVDLRPNIVDLRPAKNVFATIKNKIIDKMKNYYNWVTSKC